MMAYRLRRWLNVRPSLVNVSWLQDNVHIDKNNKLLKYLFKPVSNITFYLIIIVKNTGSYQLFNYIVTVLHTSHWTNAGLMLVYRLRRWPNINTTFRQYIVFTEVVFHCIDPQRNEFRKYSNTHYLMLPPT